jgi:hypothetical protein
MKRLLLALLAATLVALPAQAAGHPNKTDVFTFDQPFTHTAATDARFDDRAGGFRLLDDARGVYKKSGTFQSEALRYGFGFDRAVLSWNADCPAGTWITLEAQTSADSGSTWSGWYEIVAWGDREQVSLLPREGRLKQDAAGKVNEDTLELKKKANRLRYRVTLNTVRPTVTPVVQMVALALADAGKEVAADDTPGPAWGKEVAAEYRSQLVESGDMSYRLCGPSSTTMALSAHGISLPTKQVAGACWDGLNGIYGNWPFIAAAASQMMREHQAQLPQKPGYRKAARSFVAWPADWKAVEQEILDGNPVVVSIRYGQGELKGALTDESTGHLILVRGFTKGGDVIVNDPAAWKEKDGRVVYNRQELHRARHGGPVIMIRPYEAEAAR